MALTETTAPLIEPVTRNELKAHLRLDSTDDALALSQSIVPGDHVIAAAFSLEGASVVVNTSAATVYLNSGTNGAGGTVAVKLQECDDDATWVDVDGGTFTTVTVANDNATYEYEYAGGSIYLRAVATVAVATCDFAVSIATQAVTTDENDLLDGLITAARRHCEIYTGRSFIDTVWKLTTDSFPDMYELPRSPVSAVASIKYYDVDDAQQTLAAAYYDTDFQNEPARIVQDPDYTWPDTYGKINAVEVNFTAGYGVLASDVPEQIKLAIKMLAAHWYENREPVLIGVSQSNIPMSVDSLLWQYRLRDVV